MAVEILHSDKMEVTLQRLCYELIENHGDFANSVLIGMQPRGIYLARHLVNKLKKILKTKNLTYGELDITFFRDDFRYRDKQLVPSEMDINFSVEGKNVILIDDVIYTGRSLRSAMDALLGFGRPGNIEFLALVDRRFSRQLPIDPTYTGMNVDSRSSEKVIVEWQETEGSNKVWLLTTNENNNESAAS